MPDVDQGPGFVDNPSPENTRVFLAGFTTLVLASASLVLWRRRALVVPPADSTKSADTDSSKPSILHAALATLRASPSKESDMTRPSAAEGSGSGGESKAARSKERRRRGKDPLKELMKGGKRTKSLLKQLSSASASSSSVTLGVSVPRIVEPGRESQRGSSVATSSRSSSVSAARSSDEKAPDSVSCFSSAGTDSNINGTERSGDTQSATSSSSSTCLPPLMPPAMVVSASAPDFDAEILSTQRQVALRVTQSEVTQRRSLPDSAKDEATQILDLTSTPPSRSASAASDADSQSASGSITTTSTSPPPSLAPEKDRASDGAYHLYPSQSMPPHVSSFDLDTTPPSRNHINHNRNHSHGNGNGSWDWSIHQPSTESTTYRKPPRFRSKSRAGSGGSPMSSSLSYNLPFAAPFSSSSPTSPSAAPADAMLQSFTYPTLNPSPLPSPSPASASASSANSHLGAHPPRRTPTPSPTPPPSGGSGGVSAQTQLASMRGALEAARMREEKSRHDADNYARECETLRRRWGEDVVGWRRREMDYQTQIHYLTHQLQAYASLSAHASASASASSHLQVPTSQSYPSQNSSQPLSTHSPSSSSVPQSPSQSQPHNLNFNHPFPPFFIPQMVPTPGTLTSPTQSPFGHVFPGTPPNQSSLFSLFFPAAPAPAPAAPSASGTSSAGSISPVMDFSSLKDRGRRRTRNGTGDEGWVELSDGVGDEGARDDGEREFNDVLADAILKRPESIRVRPEKKAGESSRHAAQVFTFPSLSNMGNVDRGYEDAHINDPTGEAGDGGSEEETEQDVSGAGAHTTPKGASTVSSSDGRADGEERGPAG